MLSATGEVTKLLAALKNGDAHAEAKLVALVYRELHGLAQLYMRRERPDHTLQPTALVNEAYLRLMGQNARAKAWEGRNHFVASAAIAMRRVLVEHARQRGAAKRLGGKQKVELDEVLASAEPRIEELLILDQALTRLAGWNGRHARLVEMMFFGGLTVEEAAGVLGISARTAERDWKAARAWLQVQLGKRVS